MFINMLMIHLDGEYDVIGSDVVLVDGLEPSDVVVAVRHHVNVQLPGHHPRRRVVRDVHRLARAPHGGGEGEEQPEPHGAHGAEADAAGDRSRGRGRDGLRQGPTEPSSGSVTVTWAGGAERLRRRAE
jgi:hypothetical protein